MPQPARAERATLVLLLAPFDLPARDLVSASLAALSERAGVLFELYLGALRLGFHWGGGDPERAAEGAAMGGNAAAGGHLEAFCYLASTFDLKVLVAGEHPFEGLLSDFDIQVLARSAEPAELYLAFARALAIELPEEVLVVDPYALRTAELLAFIHPEIAWRDRLALPAWTPVGALKRLREHGVRHHLESELLQGEPGFGELSRRAIALFGAESREVLLGDPALVAHWIPWCARHRALALHERPQIALLDQIEGLRAGEHTVWGRQYDDRDFTELSRRDLAFQVIDPHRPVFPVVETVAGRAPQGDWRGDPRAHEVDDATLERWAGEGRILASIIFWSGAARELENLPRIADLLHITGLKAGVALGAAAARFGRGGPLALLGLAREHGGVFPLLEPLLGSSGTGISFESLLDARVLGRQLESSREALRTCALVPRVRGWWPTLDGALIEERQGSADARRPYEHCTVGRPDPALFEMAADAGLEYAISKYAFGPPAVVHEGQGIIVPNYTAGRWEGWSPFVAIASYGDLARAERRLVSRNRPGWLLGSIDTCLWLFSLHQWERAGELRRIADHLVVGGRSRLLINVLPDTIARYARILTARGEVPAMSPQAPQRWSANLLGLSRWAWHYGRMHMDSWRERRR